MLKWILGAVVVLVAVFAGVVALQPADFRVERSATIRAPAIAPFTQVGGMFEQGLAQMKSVVETQR